MRSSELIGQLVVDSTGRELGIVVDLRCVQDGPLTGVTPVLRVHALIVSGRHTGTLLGYDRRAQQGPWLIRRAVQRLHPNLQVIPWTAVADHTPQVRLNIPASVSGCSRSSSTS